MSLVVIGGGFAGFWAALAARRVAGPDLPIAMVSREPVLQMRPRLYEAHPETLGIDLEPLLDRVGVRFVAGEAIGLDTSLRQVALKSGSSLAYERLVVATGSVMQRPPVPGAARAWSIDSQREAIAFDRRLREIASSRPTIAVVGAGFTGIELALELRDRIGAHGGDGESARIVLIDRAPVVGAELGAGPRSIIEASLAAARIEVRLAATVTALAADRVSLADGYLDADAVVLTTGLAAADFVRFVPGERGAGGRILVDTALRAPAASDVFVAGDAALADTGTGHRALQSCQHALQLGRFAGENAARDLLGMEALPYAQPRYVTCLDLGRSGAVFTEGWDRRVSKTGAEAKALKRRINTVVIYPPAQATAERLLALSDTDYEAQRRAAGL